MYYNAKILQTQRQRTYVDMATGDRWAGDVGTHVLSCGSHKTKHVLLVQHVWGPSEKLGDWNLAMVAGLWSRVAGQGDIAYLHHKCSGWGRTRQGHSGEGSARGTGGRH